MNNDLISREALLKEVGENKEFFETERVYLEGLLLNAPTVEAVPLEFHEKVLDNATKELFECQAELERVRTETRPQGERAERALAIIDRLRKDGHINNKEQGTLRRAILLPERPKGKWFEYIDKGLLKARHGDYVLYQVDYLLDNLAREVNIMEGARKMEGGADMRGEKE